MSLELIEFIVESNQIERITHPPTDAEIKAHERILALAMVTVADLERFVQVVAGAPLRRHPHHMVHIVGSAVSRPPGGPHIAADLAWLLDRACSGIDGAQLTHVQYELLHPFMDGNGRSGRVLWAWQMQQGGADPFALPFLQRFYYQTIEAAQNG